MKALNLKGVEVCGAKVLEEEGNFQRGRAWKVQCKCGGTFKLGAGVINQAIKGNPSYTCRMHCRGCGRKPGVTHTKAYIYWTRRRDEMCSRWQAFEVFKDECYVKRNARHLCRRDFTIELSPDNFYWSAHPESYHQTFQECVNVLVCRGMSTLAATERANSISRQRRAQIIARSKGLCCQCFQPSKTWRCKACQH